MAQIEAKDEDLKRFLEAADFWNGGSGMADDANMTAKDLLSVNESLADFEAKWGRGSKQKTGLRVWDGIQTRKGARRGLLLVLEIEGGTLSHFDGEV